MPPKKKKRPKSYTPLLNKSDYEYFLTIEEELLNSHRYTDLPDYEIIINEINDGNSIPYEDFNKYNELLASLLNGILLDIAQIFKQEVKNGQKFNSLIDDAKLIAIFKELDIRLVNLEGEVFKKGSPGFDFLKFISDAIIALLATSLWGLISSGLLAVMKSAVIRSSFLRNLVIDSYLIDKQLPKLTNAAEGLWGRLWSDGGVALMANQYSTLKSGIVALPKNATTAALTYCLQNLNGQKEKKVGQENPDINDEIELIFLIAKLLQSDGEMYTQLIYDLEHNFNTLENGLFTKRRLIPSAYSGLKQIKEDDSLRHKILFEYLAVIHYFNLIRETIDVRISDKTTPELTNLSELDYQTIQKQYTRLFLGIAFSYKYSIGKHEVTLYNRGGQHYSYGELYIEPTVIHLEPYSGFDPGYDPNTDPRVTKKPIEANLNFDLSIFKTDRAIVMLSKELLFLKDIGEFDGYFDDNNYGRRQIKNYNSKGYTILQYIENHFNTNLPFAGLPPISLTERLMESMLKDNHDRFRDFVLVLIKIALEQHIEMVEDLRKQSEYKEKSGEISKLYEEFFSNTKKSLITK